LALHPKLGPNYFPGTALPRFRRPEKSVGQRAKYANGIQWNVRQKWDNQGNLLNGPNRLNGRGYFDSRGYLIRGGRGIAVENGFTTGSGPAWRRRGAVPSLRKIIKTRGSFPNDDAALKLLYLAIKNAGMRWRRGIEWTAAMGQFAIQFGQRFPTSRHQR
jgi:putative transposase